MKRCEQTIYMLLAGSVGKVEYGPIESVVDDSDNLRYQLDLMVSGG